MSRSSEVRISPSDPERGRAALPRWTLGLFLPALAVVAATLYFTRSSPPPGMTPLVEAPRTGQSPVQPPPRGSDPAAVKRPVRGRVLGPDGKGVEGADVAVFALHGNETALPEPYAVGRSDAEGRFELELTLVRDLAVAARKPGLVSALVAVADARRALVLRMANTYEVRGYVSDAFAPVAGCEVVLEPEDGHFFSHVTRTGTDGAFRFTGIYPGLVSLSARAPLYRPTVQRGIVVGPGEPLRLQFHEAALGLQGRVWLAGTQPVPAAGATVRATAQRDDRMRPHAIPHVTEVRTDGTFDLFGLGAGLHRIDIAHADRSTATRIVEVEASAAAVVDVQLLPRVPVRGRLVGSELLNTELLLVTHARERARTRTDTGGRFEFPGTYSAGPATLVLHERAICFERSSERSLAVELGADALSLTVAPALLLTGDVADPNGRAIAGAEVYVDSEWQPAIDLLREPAAITDSEGGYRLHVALNAAPELMFRHPEFAVATLRLSRQASGVLETITLHPPSKIAGVVRRDGKPLPAAIVHLPPGGPTRAWATTDPHGAFTLHGVPPGEHQLLVRYGTLTEFSARAIVQPGRDTENVELTLPPGRTLRGRVTDPWDRPVSGVLVSVDAALGAATTDASGGFVLDAPRGEVLVRAFSPDWHLEETQRVGAEGTSVSLVLAVPPHGRLQARVPGEPGRRPIGALVNVMPLDAAPDQDASEAKWWVDVRDGEINFPRFPAGRSRLRLHCGGYVPFVTEVNLVAGGKVDLGVCRLEPGAKVRGVVVDEAGRAVPGARVLLGTELDFLVMRQAAYTRGDAIFGTRADLRGRFEVAGVSSSLHTLVIHGAGFAIATVELQIPRDLLRQDPIEVKMPAGADIVARVVGARDQPIAGRTVELRKSGFSIDASRTDGVGCCVFRHGSPGEYRLSVLGTVVSETVEVGGEKSYEVMLRVEDR